MGDLAGKGYVLGGMKGYPKVTTTYRTPAEENALAPNVTAATGETSKHCVTLVDGTPAAKAFDITFFNADGKPVKDGYDQRYTDIGACWMKYASEPANVSLKLVWGGTWHKPHDPGHCQIA